MPSALVLQDIDDPDEEDDEDFDDDDEDSDDDDDDDESDDDEGETWQVSHRIRNAKGPAKFDFGR